MNRKKWEDAIFELENLIKYKTFDQARERLANLHQSLQNDDHDLTTAEYYTVLLNIAGCYVELGSAANNRQLLDAGNAILERHKNEFPHLIILESRPVNSQMPLISWASSEDEKDKYKDMHSIIIVVIIAVVMLILFLFY